MVKGLPELRQKGLGSKPNTRGRSIPDTGYSKDKGPETGVSFSKETSVAEQSEPRERFRDRSGQWKCRGQTL